MASKRVSATNKGPAVEGRWSVVEPDSAGQAKRDRYFQTKMAEERNANVGLGGTQEELKLSTSSLSDTELIDKYLANPKTQGPARGVMAELKRIDPSGVRQCSTAVEQRCNALGWCRGAARGGGRSSHIRADLGPIRLPSVRSHAGLGVNWLPHLPLVT